MPEAKHHYIPIFYLKQWTEPNGRLVEFSRQGPLKGLRYRWTSPSDTGYVRGLNTVPGVAPELAEFVEKEFMGAVDHWAALALQVFLSPSKRDLTNNEAVGWARFLYSLIVRTPENMAQLGAKAAEHKVQAPTAAILPTIINSKRVIEKIIRMTFHTADFPDTKHRFLTSDRPILMTNGLEAEDAQICLPISQTRLFIAVKTDATFQQIRAVPPDGIVYVSNDRVALQARKYVYAHDTSQARFIGNRLGKMYPSTPYEA